MKGLGTDEDAIYTILENRSPAERRAIEATLTDDTVLPLGRFRAWLRDDLSGSSFSVPSTDSIVDAVTPRRSEAPNSTSDSIHSLNRVYARAIGRSCYSTASSRSKHVNDSF